MLVSEMVKRILFSAVGLALGSMLSVMAAMATGLSWLIPAGGVVGFVVMFVVLGRLARQ